MSKLYLIKYLLDLKRLRLRFWNILNRGVKEKKLFIEGLRSSALIWVYVFPAFGTRTSFSILVSQLGREVLQ